MRYVLSSFVPSLMNNDLTNTDKQHAVEPMGSRRFSMTCRYIDPTKMKTQADRDNAAIKGAIPEHAREFVYDGEA